MTQETVNEVREEDCEGESPEPRGWRLTSATRTSAGAEAAPQTSTPSTFRTLARSSWGPNGLVM